MIIRRPSRRLSSRLSAWLAGALVALLAALVVIATLDLATWLLLDRSWAEVEEIQGILMVWFGLLGAAYALAEGLHLAVDVVVGRLPAALRRWVARGASAAVAAFGVLTAVYATRLASSVTNTLPATGWSASLEYLPAVVAGALIAVIGCEQAVWPESGPSTDPAAPEEAVR